MYPALMGIAVWMAGITPAAAAPDLNLAQGAPPSTESLDRLKVANPITPPVEPAPNGQIERAAAAIEIKPGDWAYQTLQSLNAKYDCGNIPTGAALSRTEFATGVNSCIESMEQLVARKQRKQIKKKRTIVPRRPVESTPQPMDITPSLPPDNTPPPPPPPAPPEVSQQDLDQLKQLVQSFRSELQGIDARLQNLDAKTAELQAKSFSTTTKLVGEAIFAVTGLAGGPSTASRNTIFSDRVRLNFRSSFTGKDLLLARLQSRNSTSFAGAASGTNMTRLGFEGSEDNATTIHRLQYQMPVSPDTKLSIEAVGSEFNDNYYTFNPEHQSAGTGAVTRFGRFNPIYRLSGEGAGIGVDHKFSPNLGFSLSYAVPRVVTPATPAAGGNPAVPATPATESANNPAGGSGLFNGSNVIFSQFTLKPSDDVSLGLAYARSYNSTGTGLSGATGSNIANNPFNSSGAALVPTTANHYSLMGSVNLSKDLIFSAWGGLTQAKREGTGDTADIWNYAATLAAKDFGSKGSTLGFVVGMQPKLTSNGGATAARTDSATSLHLETFYKYKLNDNIFITPGLLILTNPEHNAANPTEYLGTIRTTFAF